MPADGDRRFAERVRGAGAVRDQNRWPEFIAKAKANPGKMNWTSPGAGTTPQLAGEVIKQRTGHRHAAHPVPRRRPCHQRRDRRPGRPLHRQSRLAGRPDRRRQAAPARDHLQVALARAAECPDARERPASRTPSPTRSRAVFVARRHAAADRRPAGQGARRHPRAAGHQGEIRQDRTAGAWPKAPTRSAPALPRRCRCTRRSSTRPA